MQVKINLNSLSTSKGIFKNGDIIDLPEAEVKKILAFRGFALEMLPELPTAAPVKAPVKRATRKKPHVKSIN
jgi:hypothetical protein